MDAIPELTIEQVAARLGEPAERIAGWDRAAAPPSPVERRARRVIMPP